jgi:uncharacterized protein YkwD
VTPLQGRRPAVRFTLWLALSLANGFLGAALVRADEPTETIQALLDGHNRERSRESLPPLALDPLLNKAAQRHADDMAAHHKMAHEGSDGSTPAQRLARLDYPAMASGENVAEGWREVPRVMKGWMESPPHKANILGKFTRVGFGLARDDDGNPYWSAEFATPWPSLDPDAAAKALIDAVNARRVDAKKQPLAPRPALSSAAGRVARALAKADTLDTTKAPDSDLARNLKEAGYLFRKVGQSAASGQAEAADVVKTWADDPPSLANLLDDFSDAGAGYARSSSGRPYWCLILAKPR